MIHIQDMKHYLMKRRSLTSNLGFKHPEAHRFFGVHAQQQVGDTSNGHSSLLRTTMLKGRRPKYLSLLLNDRSTFSHITQIFHIYLKKKVIKDDGTACLTIQSMRMNLSLSSLKA